MLHSRAPCAVGTNFQHQDTKTERKKLTAKRNSDMVRPTAVDSSLSHTEAGRPLMSITMVCSTCASSTQHIQILQAYREVEKRAGTACLGLYGTGHNLQLYDELPKLDSKKLRGVEAALF